MEPESLVLEIVGLSRFDRATPPVFVFGSYLGSLLVTTQRLLFLSSGDSGAGRVLAGAMLGVLTPESMRTVTVTLDEPGSLAVPHERLVACEGRRRWDFGRYLRVVYRDEQGSERATSLLVRGPVLGSEWIDRCETAVGPYLRA